MRIGLALSGGGFRATLYHLGVVRFLKDAGLLESVSHVTSVSGGSVLAAHLVLNWDRYRGTSDEFNEVAREVLDFVRLDVRNRIVRRYPFILAGSYLQRAARQRPSRSLTRTGLLENHYRDFLYGDTCLYELPRSPELHILSTNLSEGGLSSFTRSGLLVEDRSNSDVVEMRMHRSGLTTLSTAVAASSAFPGFFPPLELTAEDIGAADGEFQSQFFTDGGVYDNLGVRMFRYLEQTISKTSLVEDRQIREQPRMVDQVAVHGNGNGNGHGALPHRDHSPNDHESPETTFVEAAEVDHLNKVGFDAIIASDAGKKFEVTRPDRSATFLRTAMRSSDILMDRVWQLEKDHFAGTTDCIFAPITRVVHPEEDSTAPHPEVQLQVSRMRTDMDRFTNDEISGLVRHGYCVARQAAGSCELLNSYSHDGPPWDLIERPKPVTSIAATPRTRRGASAAAATQEARNLQRSSRRTYLTSLVSARDWVSYVYLPLLVMLVVGIPLLASRTWRHVHVATMLTNAIAETSQDYDQLLTLLEHGSVEPWKGMGYEDAEHLDPLFAEQGLDIIADTRITDLRDLVPPKGKESTTPTCQVYAYRLVSVRKVKHVEGETALRLQSLWDTAHLTARCRNPELKPELRRCRIDGTDRYRWQLKLDFGTVPVGHTCNVVVEALLPADPTPLVGHSHAWWEFEVDADPEVVTSWVLLPTEWRRTSARLVRYENHKPANPELIEPTHQSQLLNDSILHWSFVHPKAGYTYTYRWIDGI